MEWHVQVRQYASVPAEDTFPYNQCKLKACRTRLGGMVRTSVFDLCSIRGDDKAADETLTNTDKVRIEMTRPCSISNDPIGRVCLDKACVIGSLLLMCAQRRHLIPC